MFAKPGVYHVFCNIHPQMAAFLVVAPTPYVTVAGQDGAWRLEVPAGRYRVTALSERAAPVTVEVSVSGGAAAVSGLVLDESAFVSTEHLNKFGKPYPKDAYKRPRSCVRVKQDAKGSKERGEGENEKGAEEDKEEMQKREGGEETGTKDVEKEREKG